MDPVIGQAADNCGLSSQFLHQIFPSELTMWIDPREVSYRIGENGSICVLYEYKENVTEPWKPAFQNNKNSQQSTESKPENSSPTKPSCKVVHQEHGLPPRPQEVCQHCAAGRVCLQLKV